jgi:hypothetical protein
MKLRSALSRPQATGPALEMCHLNAFVSSIDSSSCTQVLRPCRREWRPPSTRTSPRTTSRFLHERNCRLRPAEIDSRHCNRMHRPQMTLLRGYRHIRQNLITYRSLGAPCTECLKSPTASIAAKLLGITLPCVNTNTRGREIPRHRLLKLRCSCPATLHTTCSNRSC